MSFHFMPFYTGDYLRDTQHLSPAEHGVYLKLLIFCWDQRGPAPLDERRLCGIVNAHTIEELTALRSVLAEFFTEDPDGFRNRRSSREIERAEVLSTKRSAAGAKGRAKQLNGERYQASAQQVPSNSPASAEQVLLHPHPQLQPKPQPRSSKTTRARKPRAQSVAALPPGVRQDVWDAWKRYRGSKLTADAVEYQTKALAKIGGDPNEVLEQSIGNGWTGLFPVKKGGGMSDADRERKEVIDQITGRSRDDITGTARRLDDDED